jgi:membrane protein
MKPKEFLALCRTSVTAWVADYAPSMGAAISYYTIFSMAPLLVIVIAIAGRVFGHDAAQGQLVAQIAGVVGPEGASAVEALLRNASEPDRGLIAGAISVVVLLVGATSVFAELQSALDRIWHVPEQEKPSGLRAVLRSRLLSFGLILGLAFLLVASFIVSAGIAAFGSWVGGLLPGREVLLQALNELISIGIFTLLFAMIFKLMPTADIAWRDVWTGAFVTAILFEIGKFLIGLYLGKSGMSGAFAAAGSLVVLVAWVYYAAQIFLLGAEFTKAYADSHGSLAGAKAMEASLRTTDTPRPVPVPEPLSNDLAMSKTAVAQEQIDRRIVEATRVLARQLAVLAALTIGNALASRWSRRQRKMARRR